MWMRQKYLNETLHKVRKQYEERISQLEGRWYGVLQRLSIEHRAPLIQQANLEKEVIEAEGNEALKIHVHTMENGNL